MNKLPSLVNSKSLFVISSIAYSSLFTHSSASLKVCEMADSILSIKSLNVVSLGDYILLPTLRLELILLDHTNIESIPCNKKLK